jgi:hypothetical protein
MLRLLTGFLIVVVNSCVLGYVVGRMHSASPLSLNFDNGVMCGVAYALGLTVGSYLMGSGLRAVGTGD